MRLLLVIVWLVVTLTIQVQAVGPEGWEKYLENLIQSDWSHATSGPTSTTDRARELDSKWIKQARDLVARRNSAEMPPPLGIGAYNAMLPQKIRLDEASLNDLRPFFGDLGLNFDGQSHDARERGLLSEARYLLILVYADKIRQANEAGKVNGKKIARDAFREADDYINSRLWSSESAQRAAYRLPKIAAQHQTPLNQVIFKPGDIDHLKSLQAAVASTSLEEWSNRHGKFFALTSEGPQNYAELAKLRREAVHGNPNSLKRPLANAFTQRYISLWKTQESSTKHEAVRALMSSFLGEAANHLDDEDASPNYVAHVLQHTKPSNEVLERVDEFRPAAAAAAAEAGPASRSRKGKSIAPVTGDVAFGNDGDPTQQPVYDPLFPTAGYQPYQPYHAEQPHSTSHQPPPSLGTLGRLLFGPDDPLDPASPPPTHRADPYRADVIVPTDNTPNTIPLSSPSGSAPRIKKSSRTSKKSASKDAAQGAGTEEMRDASAGSKSRRNRNGSGQYVSGGSGGRQSRRRRPPVEETAESRHVWNDQGDVQPVRQDPIHPVPSSRPRRTNPPPQHGHGAAGWRGYAEGYPQPGYGAPGYVATGYGVPQYGVPQYDPYPGHPGYGPLPGHPGYGPLPGHPGYGPPSGHPGYAPPVQAYPVQPYHAPHYLPVQYAPPPPPLAHYPTPPPMHNTHYGYPAYPYSNPHPAAPQARPRIRSQESSNAHTGYETEFSDEDASASDG